jgi:hypothetical protein
MKAKVKRIAINPEALFHIMRNDTAWRVAQGIPKDSRMRGFTLDPYTQILFLFIEHDSFEEIDLGSVAPLLETEFRRIP